MAGSSDLSSGRFKALIQHFTVPYKVIVLSNFGASVDLVVKPQTAGPPNGERERRRWEGRHFGAAQTLKCGEMIKQIRCVMPQCKIRQVVDPDDAVSADLSRSRLTFWTATAHLLYLQAYECCTEAARVPILY